MAVNQLKAGAALSYISIGLNNIIGLLYTPYMLRMMGQNEYGLYSLVASVVAYLTVLDLGFGNAIVRYTAKFRAEAKTKEQYEMFGMFLVLYCAIGLVALGAGFGLYLHIDTLFGDTMSPEELGKVRVMMLLMVFNIAFTFPMSIWGAVINAYEKFVFPKAINITRIVLNTVIMVVLLELGYKAVAMVVLITLFNMVTLIINAWYCKYRLCIHVKFVRFKWGFLKEVSIYSFWLFLNAIMDRIYWSTGQFVLGMFKGAMVVVVYAIAIQLQGIYMSFSTAISGVFLPRITSMVTKGNDEKAISDIFIRIGRIQYIVMAFILSGFIVFGRPFIHLWAGTNYDDAYWITLLFFVPLTVPLIQNVGISILQARNQLRFRSLLYVIIAIASLGISIPLAKEYGGIGCAIGTALALTAGQIVAMNIYYHKKIHLDIPKFWKEIAGMSVVPIIVGIVCMLINIYIDIQYNIFTLAIGILLFSAIYLPLFWRCSMNAGERDLFAMPINRLLNKLGLNIQLG